MRSGSLVIFFLFFYSLALPAQQAHSYNPFIDVQHYAFTIEINDLNDQIKGQAEITVHFLKPTNTLTFDLIRKNAAGKGMSVISVKENNKNATFEHTAGLLKIRLKNPAKAGDSGTYKINYAGIPADGLVFSNNRFGQRTIFADNWPNRARNWLPCVDHLSDKASVEFSITAPRHYRVIGNGLLVEESSIDENTGLTHWKETVALPTKVMAIGLADFATKYEGSIDCIPVSSWVFPQHKRDGFNEYAVAMEILPFFIKMVGPYAYKKLANVEAITIFGGMENASAIFYNEQSITANRGSSEELMAHEISHQWFGNSVTETGWPHVWLSEGFATAMANLYLENKYGVDTLQATLKAQRDLVIQFAKRRFTPIVDSSEKENYIALLNRNSYEKGGWVLHMLRRKLGDTLFWKGIRAYYAKYEGKNASTNDFRLVMEETSQTDLKEFFEQWLYRAGHPELKILWKYNVKEKTLLLTVTQEQKQLFTFPLEFSFNNSGSTHVVNQTVEIKERITRVEIPMAAKPLRVIADPSTNLLFTGNPIEEK